MHSTKNNMSYAIWLYTRTWWRGQTGCGCGLTETLLVSTKSMNGTEEVGEGGLLSWCENIHFKGLGYWLLLWILALLWLVWLNYHLVPQHPIYKSNSRTIYFVLPVRRSKTDVILSNKTKAGWRSQAITSHTPNCVFPSISLIPLPFFCFRVWRKFWCKNQKNSPKTIERAKLYPVNKPIWSKRPS